MNIDWAGKVLEKITGKSLGEYSKENIFDPLGCKDIQYSKVSAVYLAQRLVRNSHYLL